MSEKKKTGDMKSHKILIVDDEKDILEFMQYNLEREGYIVEVANNGEEAIIKAEEMKPHLIILDRMMPKLDGTEVCKRLRKDERFNKTLITFLTARSEDFSQINGLDLGADDYITKPIRPRLLASRIAALLRRHQDIASNTKNIIKAANLTIDREQVKVMKGEQEIVLAKKEFELLSLLASKPGKVFRRNEIFERIWGEDVIVGNRTIDVHVRKIREKLVEDYIKTVKGIGYKFEF